MTQSPVEDWDNIVDQYQQRTSRGNALSFSYAAATKSPDNSEHPLSPSLPAIIDETENDTINDIVPEHMPRQRTTPSQSTQTLPDIIRQMSHPTSHSKQTSRRSSLSNVDLTQLKLRSSSIHTSPYKSVPTTPTNTSQPVPAISSFIPPPPSGAYRASISNMARRMSKFTFNSTDESKQNDEPVHVSVRPTPTQSPSVTQIDNRRLSHISVDTHAQSQPTRNRYGSIDEGKAAEYNTIDLTTNSINTSVQSRRGSSSNDTERQKWIEYTSANGHKLYVHTETKQVRFSGDEMNTTGISADIDTDNVHKYLSATTLSETKHNSNILGDAWAQKDELITPNNAATKQQTVEEMIESILTIERHLQHIIDSCKTQYTQVTDDLNNITSKITNVRQTFERISSNDSGTMLTALTNYDKLQQNLDNEHVHRYRATSVIDTTQYTYKQWHCPQYLSHKAVPKQAANVVNYASIILIRPEKTYSPVKQVITDTYTAQQIIIDIVTGYKLNESADTYVLKAHNTNEYMYGCTPLMSYDYTRRCLRHKTPITLHLIPAPRIPDKLPIEIEIPQLYASKIDTSIKPLLPDTYSKLLDKSIPAQQQSRMNIADIALPFSITINGLEQCNSVILPRLATVSQLYVKSYLFYGDTVINNSQFTTKSYGCNDDVYIEHQQTLYDTLLYTLPRSTRIAYVVHGKQVDGTDCGVAYIVQQLIDVMGVFVAGHYALKLWPITKTSSDVLDVATIMHASNSENHSKHGAAILHVTYDTYIKPVVSMLVEPYKQPDTSIVGDIMDVRKLNKSQLATYHKLIHTDILYELQPEDKTLLWQMRHSFMSMSNMLHKFLQSVQWQSVDYRIDAITCMRRWSINRNNIVDILPMLDYKHSDASVRQYAVSLLYTLSDEQLYTYLLQIVQCIKYEAYHSNALTTFLIQRSLLSPLHIGHYVYYYCTMEMLSNEQYSERYYCLVEQLLHLCPLLTYELHKQHVLINRLQYISELVTKLKRVQQYSDIDVTAEYMNELGKLNNDVFKHLGSVKLPYNPRLEVNSIYTQQCRYMSSKMIPLWLVFANSNTATLMQEPVYVIFKIGDDLRQDILTLQLLTLFDQLWLSQSLDLCMKPYSVIATGYTSTGSGIGFVEVVTNSDTMSGIQLKYGGALGALKNDVIDLYLHNYNTSTELYNTSVSNFIASCAGYSIATFVLGIADRHNSNIMIQQDGHLFHIDFGHFLGNFKKKFGVNRERAAFVFTTEMAYVMGGNKYKSSHLFRQYIEYCNKSFNIVRQNANTIESMFICMIASGLPELTCEADISYVRDKLYLDVDENKANKNFMNEIDKSLNTTYRRIDNMIHNLKHRYQS